MRRFSMLLDPILILIVVVGVFVYRNLLRGKIPDNWNQGPVHHHIDD